MTHLASFRPRDVLSLPEAMGRGWRLKRYAILADERKYAPEVAAAATEKAFEHLPEAGTIAEEKLNHGIGIQIVHFAETAVVSPIFYWQWGSVLAKADQLRAPWQTPTIFETGVTAFIGCVWEMDIVTFEVEAWKRTALGERGTLEERVTAYFSEVLPTASSLAEVAT